MQRFDRYVLSQLMVLFGFFSLVLVSVYWVNRAVVLFDRLIADGHSAGVFLEFTLLSLPAVILQILPMASFAATVYVTNRLSSDSELTVVQALGYSPWRLSRPVLVFGILIAVMTAMLSHILVPRSVEELRFREQEISGSVSARLLREGTFLHPSKGVTFYIRDIAADGTLHDVMLSDRRNPEQDVTYTADTAYLLRSDEGPKMVMLTGLRQTLRAQDGRLSTTDFSDLTYDISGLVTQTGSVQQRLDTLPTALLLRDPETAAQLATSNPARALEEGHMRIQIPLLSMVAAMIGFAVLQAGSFSRFGVTRQIVGAIFLLVVVKLVESAVTEPVRSDASLWPLVYLPSLVGVALVLLILLSSSVRFRRRRPRREAAA